MQNNTETSFESKKIAVGKWKNNKTDTKNSSVKEAVNNTIVMQDNDRFLIAIVRY